ncbi:MAG: DNA repair protein RecO [Pseudomonadales bacterium]
MTRVSGEQALVLHVRPYRETSAIVSLLTAGHGRIAVVARGARGGRRGSVLQPFNQVRVGFSGRGGLFTLTGSELTRHAWLSGEALACAFYVAEVVSRVLTEHDSHPRLFAATCVTVDCLQQGTPPPDVALRRFERLLLEELGYGLDFSQDADSGAPIDPDRDYLLYPDSGFVATSTGRGYRGSVLADIAADRYESRAARVAARRIFALALKPLLGPRPLASRRLLTRRSA